MKISARNTLKGKVKKITTGAVNSEIVIELPGGAKVGSKPCRSVSQGVECYSCLPKTAWPPTYVFQT